MLGIDNIKSLDTGGGGELGVTLQQVITTRLLLELLDYLQMARLKIYLSRCGVNS